MRRQRVHLAGMVAAAAGGLFGGPAFAQDFWNNPSGGSWATGTSWSLGAPPASASDTDAAFNLGSTAGYTVTLPSAESATNLYVQTDDVTIALQSNLKIGTSSANGQVDIAAAAGQSASLTVEGVGYGPGIPTAFLESSGFMSIGGAGTGALVATNGVDVTTQLGVNSNDIDVACSSAGNANVTVTDGSSLQAGVNLNIAGGQLETGASLPGGTANITLANSGSASSSFTTYVGANGGNGTVILSGGGLGGGSLIVGDAGTGLVTGSGSIFLPDNLYIGGNNGNGTVSLSGSLSYIETLQGGAVIGADPSGLAGTGLLELSNGSGCALIDQDDPNPPPTPKNTMRIDSGGTVELLTGSGVDAAELIIAGGTLTIGLGGTSTSTNGSVDLSGLAKLGGTLNVVLTGGFDPADGDQFELITFSSESGAFSAINLPPLDPGLSWNTSQLYTSGAISVVPEPAAAGLLLAAGTLLLRSKRVRV